jgi:hypothetical protein
MDFTKVAEALEGNLLAPIPLCFALGIFCKLIHGGIKIPKELYYSISIFLLMGIGFIGGHELAEQVEKLGFASIVKPGLATLFMGCVTPITAFVILYTIGRFNAADSAGIAAHYGSTSAVTFAVAQTFAQAQLGKLNVDGIEGFDKANMDGYLQTLVTILECPGIAIALAIGAAMMSKKAANNGDTEGAGDILHKEGNIKEALYEVITGQSIMLMAGMLIIGYIASVFADVKIIDGKHTQPGLQPFIDFFYAKGMIFRGALCIFLLEMGLVAGERLADLKKAGAFLIAFGILWPIAHGALAAWIGSMAGMKLGTTAVFAAIVSSASYIAAPPAVRLTLPEANPTLSITASLAITFPFNIAFGIPLYFEIAKSLVPVVTP